MKKIGKKHNFFFKKKIVDVKAIKRNFKKKELKTYQFDKSYNSKVGNKDG